MDGVSRAPSITKCAHSAAKMINAQSVLSDGDKASSTSVMNKLLRAGSDLNKQAIEGNNSGKYGRT